MLINDYYSPKIIENKKPSCR